MNGLAVEGRVVEWFVREYKPDAIFTFHILLKVPGGSVLTASV